MVAHAGVGRSRGGITLHTPPRREEEEVPQEQHDSRGEEDAGADEHQEMHLDLRLSLEIAEAQDPFEDLPNPRGRKGHRHAKHAADLQPEGPQSDFRFPLTPGVPSATAWHS